MELKDVIGFIRNANAQDRQVLKAELKNPPIRSKVNDVCSADIRRILDAFPHTTDSYKGYRYDATAVSYVQAVKMLTNAITHNYIAKHNTRGYLVWTGSEIITGAHEDKYAKVFHQITDLVLDLLNEYTAYTHSNSQ